MRNVFLFSPMPLFCYSLANLLFLYFTEPFLLNPRIWEEWNICNIPLTLIRRMHLWLGSTLYLKEEICCDISHVTQC